ncbi:DUF6894 family protein [Pseudorhizobium pelagicum]|uniref:DUF6894 domain-containing protein n=1 Tax=Pseudorhizobium pelagicum TaxID=1509405 RepID=A0A922T7S9_9HYPH|nr:hypothetical protein [Pseudorhizobium pelagicum]KEQ07421.1 hypothetical protein GV67_21910 [Pseudorhizobium pelagicum]KEQ09017.1 hypothetical protein GV68_24920 [Pseudorhizobium pelagicum]
MPRYFFHHVWKAGQVRDLEGSELPDLEHARTEAIMDARSLMSDAIRQGRDISSRSIQISDEGGTVLLTVPFADAVIRDD